VSHLVFVKAAALSAILDRDDPGYALLSHLWRFEMDVGSTLVTTNYAVLRASNELQRRHGATGLRALHESLLPALRVEWCTRADHEQAVAVILAAHDERHDLIDRIEEQVRRRLRIDDVMGLE
jgi:hypothetical protein